ncbi:MAG: sporulation integral membrane protein YtvI [Firmicutes bacterium]|nr:sporulation integral membrane protein YtvI [Bacillota bacterium]
MGLLRGIVTPKRVVLAAVIIAIAVLFSKQLATTFLPFLIGLGFAILLEPVIGFLEQQLRFPRGLAVLTTLVAVTLLTWYTLFLIVGKIITELTDLASLLPLYRETVTDLTNELLGQFERLNENLPPMVSLNIQHSVKEFLLTLEATTKDLINQVLAAFTSLPVFLVVSLVSLVSTFFIARDKDLIVDTLMGFVPFRLQEQVKETRKRVAIDLFGFIKGRILMLIISVLIAGVGLFLIGTRYWLLIAIAIGVLDNIPIVGPGIIFTPWVAVSVLLGNLNRAVYLTILYLVIFSVRQLSEPKIMGDSVGIHPLVMLLAIYGGIVFFGFLGIFLGPILAILIRAATLSGLFKFPPYPEK